MALELLKPHNIFQNRVAAYINWGDITPLLYIYADTKYTSFGKGVVFWASDFITFAVLFSENFRFLLCSLQTDHIGRKENPYACVYLKNQGKMTP